MPTILISNNTIKGYAGSELVTIDLAIEFKLRGYDVTIATFGKDASVVRSLDGLDVKWLDLNIEQVNAEKIIFDVIWAHHFTTLDAILIDLEISAAAIIFSSLSPYESLESPPAYAPQLSLILANSEETKNQLLDYGLPLDMVHVFPNPVAREWFCVAKAASNSRLRKLAIVSNHVVSELRDLVKHLQDLGVLVEIFGVEYNFVQVTPALLAGFDCIVTIGRTVQQAMVLGLPVYCYDRFGGPGYLNVDNFEKAGLFNYSGRCCGSFKSAEMMASELLHDYRSAVTSASNLQLIAREKYRLDTAVGNVLKIIAGEKIDFLAVSAALKLPSRMRRHLVNNDSNHLYAQLFLDNGVGISESTSLKVKLKSDQFSHGALEANLVFDLSENHNLVNLRFDPLNRCAVISINRAELLMPDGCVDLTERVKTNSKECLNNVHFFIDDDPQFFFTDTNFNGAICFKVFLTYHAVGVQALKKFIDQYDSSFIMPINITESALDYNQILQKVITHKEKSFAPIQKELLMRIDEVAIINQKIRKIDEVISRVDQENHEREQHHLGQLTQVRQQIEARLLQLAEREKASSELLQQTQQAHEQQKSEQGRAHAEREQHHLGQLTQARQQIEAQLLQLAEREKASSELLQEMQQAQTHQINALSQQQADREQAHNKQLAANEAELLSQRSRWAETQRVDALAIDELRRELNAMRSTRSWRWTAGLRGLTALLKR